MLERERGDLEGKQAACSWVYPIAVPGRGALIAHIAHEIALAQCWIEHGLQAENMEAQECAKVAMVAADLNCGEDVDETVVCPEIWTHS